MVQAMSAAEILAERIARYGYLPTLGGGVRCQACGADFPRADGSVMRGHASRCPVDPRHYPIPAVCDA